MIIEYKDKFVVDMNAIHSIEIENENNDLIISVMPDYKPKILLHTINSILEMEFDNIDELMSTYNILKDKFVDEKENSGNVILI